jgi:hypothetical protein
MPNGVDPAAEEAGDRFSVRLLVTRQQAAELLARDDLDFGCRPHLHPNPDGTATLDVLALRSTIDELRRAGHRLEVGENVSAAGRARQREVGEGDRFEGGRLPPRGLGRKSGNEQS